METKVESLLSKSLTQGEYESLNVELRTKIETALNEHMDDFLTAKALFESTRASQGRFLY
jgi:transposase-like protein